MDAKTSHLKCWKCDETSFLNEKGKQNAPIAEVKLIKFYIYTYDAIFIFISFCI